MRLTQELGTVLHSPPSRFEVLETKTLPGTGTLIVDFSIAPPLTPSAPSSDTLRRKLVHQIASGALFHHPILHSINPQYGVTEVSLLRQWNCRRRGARPHRACSGPPSTPPVRIPNPRRHVPLVLTLLIAAALDRAAATPTPRRLAVVAGWRSSETRLPALRWRRCR